MRAALRICACCEWIFKNKTDPTCPECGFGSYSARYVYGSNAYTYQYTQKPWLEKKLENYESKLRLHIQQQNASVKHKRKNRVAMYEREI